MVESLGLVLARIAEYTPGGILVFFPSYSYMNFVFNIWWKGDTLDKIQAHKKVFRESNKAEDFQKTLDDYYRRVFKGGAILLGVCRGRISEGLDFSDDAARCVLVVGIPYPQLADPKIILKK